ncbi:MAG: imidazole glycerol phosphate synthase subunit HisH [Rhodothermales bacterium]
MLCIIDYGIGNLRSMEKAVEAVGAEVVRSDDPAVIAEASHVILPGVGAFGACADEIRRRDLEGPIHAAIASGKPFLGVCVGMQLLFDYSEEMGRHEGLGYLPGRVIKFLPSYAAMAVAGDDAAPEIPLAEGPAPLKIPHMGWNSLAIERETPLLDGLPDAPFFYFVHSYHADANRPSDVVASTRYGRDFPAVVGRNNVYGVQFHPEKSHDNGLRILKNFASLRP